MVSTGYFLREMTGRTVADDGGVFVHDVPDCGGGGEDDDGGIDYL